MKKYIYAMCIILLIVMNFTACNSSNPTDVDIAADEKIIEENIEDSNVVNNNEESTENNDKDNVEESIDNTNNKLIPLEEATREQLGFININKTINNRLISFNLADTSITSNTAYFNEYNNFVRSSTKLLYCEGYDDKYNTEDFQSSIVKENYDNIQSYETPLTVRPLSPYAIFNGFSEITEIIKAESFNFGYFC